MSLHTTPDSYTKLLIHSDTSDTITTFVDSSPSGHTITANGTAQHKTAQKKFGATSMWFDGNSDSLTTPDSDDWHFSDGDFTIDSWCYFTDFSDYNLIVGHDGDVAGVKGWHLRTNSGGSSGANATLFRYTTDGSTEVNLQATTNMLTNTWHHVAFVRSSDTYTFYVDGVSKGTGTLSATLSNVSTTLRVGMRDDDLHYIGYMDELRVSKGIARWTDSFVPPNKPYSVVDDDFVTDAAGIEDDGSGNTTFGRDIIVKSNPDEASTDIVFSVQDKVGIERLGVKANGVLYNESSIASTTPRVIMGDGWLSGDYPAASRGTYFQGYQTVTSGNPIIVGKSEYSTGTLDGAITGILSVTYTQDGDANRSGYYLFRIGYTGDTTTTTVQSSVQSSSCTCTKTNSGGVMSLNVTPTTFASATVKVFYTFQGIISQDL